MIRGPFPKSLKISDGPTEKQLWTLVPDGAFRLRYVTEGSDRRVKFITEGDDGPEEHWVRVGNILAPGPHSEKWQFTGIIEDFDVKILREVKGRFDPNIPGNNKGILVIL